MRKLMLLTAVAALLAAPATASEGRAASRPDRDEVPATTAATAPDCPRSPAAGAGQTGDDAPGAQTYTGAGKVLCAKCDLDVSAACQSMFKTTDDRVFALCSEGVAEQLLKLTRHGELDVTVHGEVVTTEDGREVLYLEGFTVGTI